MVTTGSASGSLRGGIGLNVFGLNSPRLNANGAQSTSTIDSTATSYALNQQATQQSSFDDAFWMQTVPSNNAGPGGGDGDGNMGAPSMGTTVFTDHRSAQSSFSLQYNETLAAGQKDFVLDDAQTDRTFSEQTGSGSMSMDSTSQSAHTFSMHQEGTSDGVGQGFAFVSHAYDDARWTSDTSSSGQNSSSAVTTDVYKERMVDASVGSFTEVRTTTTSSTGGGMPGNPQTTTTTTSGTFALNDPNHFAPGGPTGGTLALNQVFAQFQALGQQAALDLQKAIQACAASGRDTTGVIASVLVQRFLCARLFTGFDAENLGFSVGGRDGGNEGADG